MAETRTATAQTLHRAAGWVVIAPFLGAAAVCLWNLLAWAWGRAWYFGVGLLVFGAAFVTWVATGTEPDLESPRAPLAGADAGSEEGR